MIQFGGDWTNKKIEILVEYAKAYLTIMNRHPYWKLLYFDGFAGSGLIVKENEIDFNITTGAARRIVEIDTPRPFDHYYFVEKSKTNSEQLSLVTKKAFPHKKIRIIVEDCNLKLKDMAKFLLSDAGKKISCISIYRSIWYAIRVGLACKFSASKY
jgi:three-Cys-motif partner protein